MAESIAGKEGEIFPVCRELLDARGWQEFCALLAPAASLAELTWLLARPLPVLPGAPDYLPALARLELALHEARQQGMTLPISLAGAAEAAKKTVP